MFVVSRCGFSFVVVFVVFGFEFVIVVGLGSEGLEQGHVTDGGRGWDAIAHCSFSVFGVARCIAAVAFVVVLFCGFVLWFLCCGFAFLVLFSGLWLCCACVAGLGWRRGVE